jgi:flavin reductase (DIM6/NTAB) family NADH-FMN oxidoreductase RutF
MTGEIHDEHPFLLPVEERDPARRLRGRLAAPVTIVTAGEAANRTGLTVSSLVVAEGGPPQVSFLLSVATDLYSVLQQSGRFVVHVCEQAHRERSDVFAGLRPSPGGLFTGAPTSASKWGPVFDDMASRAYCSVAYLQEDEMAYSVLVVGTIDEIELHELIDPLLYFRGAYRRLG